MSDDAERNAVRTLNRMVGLDLIVSGLSGDAAQALFDRLNARLGSSRAKHDHPLRPVCWACGSGHASRASAYQHTATCHAVLSHALAAVDYEDDWNALRNGDPTHREYYGAILERGRAAGADMKALRRDPDAIERWTGDEPP